MGSWTWCCFRHEPAYKKIDAENPVQYVSARLESESDEYEVETFHLSHAVSSLYRKVSSWSLPKKQLPEKQNLFTMNEAEHDFLLDEPGSKRYVRERLESKDSVDLEEEDVPLPSRPKHTVSSIYNKVSEWTLPTVHEGEHESLMDKYTPSVPSPCPSCDGPSPSPSSPPPQTLPDFDDVVDEMV